eukprot:1205792-Rhodomonas_salina.1
MSGKLFEGLSAPEPLKGTVQTTLTLETGALDVFLKDLLEALKKLGKDVSESQERQEQLAKEIATNKENTDKEINALKEQLKGGGGAAASTEAAPVVEAAPAAETKPATPQASSRQAGDDVAKLRKELKEGLEKGQKERSAPSYQQQTAHVFDVKSRY